MRGGFIVPAELGEGRTEVQMRVDMVRLSFDDRLKIGRGGSKIPLPKKGHSEPEARKARARFDGEDAKIGVLRRRKLFAHEVGMAEIPVIGGNPSFDADRFLQEPDRLHMIAPLAGDDAKEMERDMIARIRGYQGAQNSFGFRVTAVLKLRRCLSDEGVHSGRKSRGRGAGRRHMPRRTFGETPVSSTHVRLLGARPN